MLIDTTHRNSEKTNAEIKFFKRVVKIKNRVKRYYDLQFSDLEKLYIFYNNLTFKLVDAENLNIKIMSIEFYGKPATETILDLLINKIWPLLNKFKIGLEANSE